MGLHSPFGYVGYEFHFLSTVMNMLDTYCRSCHTNEDFGGCHGCPVGSLIFASENYLLDAYESETLTAKARIIRRIKHAIKPIEPHPMFNAGFVLDAKRAVDQLSVLRELAKDLEFEEYKRSNAFMMKQSDYKRVTAYMNWEKELAPRKRLMGQRKTGPKKRQQSEGPNQGT